VTGTPSGPTAILGDYIVENAPAWFALYVKPRHEFLVRSDLENNGREVYLPAVNKVSQWKDRKKRIDFPLFPGYLFARVVPESECFLGLMKTRGVMKILSAVPGHPTPVPDGEIAALKTLLAGDKELDIHPELQAGKVVRIKKGVFESVEGVLSKKGDQFLLHVNITMLGRCVTVKLFADDVELA
jgi:transcription termination/antitermination protein NusG